MKLFAIRVENGTIIVVSAKNQELALKEAGLTGDVFQQLEEQGDQIDHAALVENGVGPQRYEIIEMPHLQIRVALDEKGDLELVETEDQTHESLYQLYPIVDAAITKAVEKCPTFYELLEAQDENLIAEALDQEKTRLMLPSEADLR